MLAGHDTESMEWAEEDGWRRHKEEEGGGLDETQDPRGNVDEWGSRTTADDTRGR